MKRSFLLLLIAFFCLVQLVAQPSERPIVNVHGVIVGVSAYKNLSQRQQLKYAHSDAIKLYNLLITLGANKDNLELLLNEKANSISFIARLTQVFAKAKDGDQVIIYFAGHGDTHPDLDIGYLLFHNASTDGDYAAGDAYSIDKLNDLIETGTENKKLDVILITDACRSGSLISDYGANVSQQHLSEVWEHTYKLLSCKADEFSYEGPKWEGGAFTNNLVFALSGLADNNNKKLTIEEIHNYVFQNVRKETSNRQSPQLASSKKMIVAGVDPELKKRAKELKKLGHQLESLSRIKSVDLSTSGELAVFLDAVDDDMIMPNKFLPQRDRVVPAIVKNSSSLSIKRLNNEKITTLVADPLQEHFVFGTSGGRVELWNINQNNLVKGTYVRRIPISCTTYSNNGKTLAIGGGGDITLHRANNLGYYKTIPIKSRINVISFSQNDDYLLCGDANGQIHIWNMNLTKNVIVKKIHKTSIQYLFGLSIQNENYIISVPKEEQKIYLWKLSKTDKKGKSKLSLEDVYRLSDIPKYIDINRNQLLISYENQKSDILDLRTFELINHTGLQSSINNLFFIDNYAITLTDKSMLSLYELPNYDTPISSISYGDKIENVALSVSTQKLIVANASGKVYIVDVQIPRPFAVDLYASMSKDPKYAPYSDKLTGTMAIGLQKTAQRIITSFIKGEDVQPTLEEVQEALFRLELVENYYPDNNVFQKQIEIKQNFLKGYEILVRSDFDRYDEAIGHFQKLLELQPNASYPYNALSIVYQRRNEFQSAKENLNKSINAIPAWTEPKSNMGKTLSKEGDYGAAMLSFDKIIEVNPGITKGYINKAGIYMLNGAFLTAAETYDQALQVDSQSTFLHAAMGDLYTKRAMFTDANAYLIKSKKLAPTFYLPYLYTANLNLTLYEKLYRTSNYLQKAHEELKQALEFAPNEPEVHLQYAEFYRKIYELAEDTQVSPRSFMEEELKIPVLSTDEVIAAYDRSLVLDPFFENGFGKKALFTLTVIKDPAAAQRILDAFQNKLADFPTPFFYQGKYFVHQDNKEEAIRNYEIAIEKNDQFLPAYLALWELYEADNRSEDIDAFYEKCRDKFIDNPVFPYFKAIYLFKKGAQSSSSEVENLLKTALEIDPAYAYAQTFLANLSKDNSSDAGNSGIQYNYSKRTDLGNGNYLVYEKGKYGIIDMLGMVTRPVEYSYAEILPSNTKNNVIIGKEGKYGLIDASGEALSAMDYDRIEKIDGRIPKIARVEKDGKLGGINLLTGKLIIPIEYERISYGTWSGKGRAMARRRTNDSERLAMFFNEDGNWDCTACPEKE